MQKSIKFQSTHKFIVIDWMENMEKAHRKMSEISARHLPVVDESGLIIGMLSDHDVQRAMKINPSDFFSGKILPPEFDPDTRVRDYMSWPVETIDEAQPITDAAKAMIEKKISSLIVTRGSFAVAVVTTEDLLRTLLEEHQSPLQVLKENIISALYRSPIGNIAQSLANSGL